MAKMIYFSGETELTDVHGLDNAKFAAEFPNVKGRSYDGFSKMIGHPATNRRAAYLPVERVIEYKSNPSRHECDARCMNATGRIMKCECSCGGKNHGKSSFKCD